MRMTFLLNLGLLAWTAAVWTGCGYGFVRGMLPRRGWREAVLLAPLVGACLLGLLGFFEVAVLLVPLRPWLNAAALLVLSALLARYAGRKDRAAVGLKGRQLAWLCLTPAASLAAFAWLFHAQGFHLLVGSQDQIQYCENARHVLEVMHTGAEADVPVPRQDHLVSDFCTRFLPYLREYRRGAEVLLATTMALCRSGPQQAFPLTVAGGYFTLGLSLAYLGHRLLRLRLASCILLQLLLLGSAHLTLLHYQGSLAHLLALPLCLLALPATARALRAPSVGHRLLAGLLCGSLFTFYNEPVAVVLLLPLGAYVCWRAWASPRQRGRLALRLAAVLAVALAVSPLAVQATKTNTVSNLQKVRAGLTQPRPAAAEPARPSPVRSPFWAQTANVLGLTSYFDTTRTNADLSRAYAVPAWRGCAACALLWAAGLAGLLLRRRAEARLFALVLLAWAGGAFAFAHSQDQLRFWRSVQYTMPFALVGLVLLAETSSRRPVHLAVTWPVQLSFGPVQVAVVLLLAVNLFTVYRTARYTVARDAHTDAVLFRFEETAPEWVALRRHVAESSGGSPVLISGYKDTIRPHLLAVGTAPNPHFLGDSIAGFWPLPRIHQAKVPEVEWPRVGTRVSRQRFIEEYYRQQRPSWSELSASYLARSVVAVVPPGHGYPEEWRPWRDVYPPLVERGHPLCDLVHKDRHLVRLSSAGDLQHDAQGPYRLLLAPEAELTLPAATRPSRLHLRYEGAAPSQVEVHVDGGRRAGEASTSPDGLSQVSVLLPPGAKVVRIVFPSERHPVKLRELRLDEAAP
jgi:hypothetical protein